MNGDKIKKINNNGFTLIEMMVAVSLFAVVVTVALGAFLNVSEIQNKAMAVRAVNDNLNFAVEMMMREIRTGRDYSVSVDTFNFTNARGCEVEYSLLTATAQVARQEKSGPIPCLSQATPMPITSEDVEIDEFKFFLDGQGVSDTLQPIVTIIIGGSAGTKEKLKSRLNLQVTISQRDLDS